MTALVTLVLTVLIAIQVPAVQTMLTRKALDRIEKSLDAEIRFSEIGILPFTTLVIKDLAVIDKEPAVRSYFPVRDTLLKVKTINASFTLAGLLDKEHIKIRKVKIDTASLNIVTEQDYGLRSNLQRMFHLYPPDSVKEGDVLSIKRLDADHFTLSLFNAMSEPAQESLEALSFPVIDAEVHGKKLKVSGGVFYAGVDRICGEVRGLLNIKSLRGDVAVSQKNLDIKNMVLDDGNSEICLREFSIHNRKDILFRDIAEAGVISCRFNPTRLSSKTLSNLLPSLSSTDLTLLIDSGRLDGTVKDFRFSGFSIVQKESGISGSFAGHITDIDDKEKMSLDCFVNDCSFTSGGISSLTGQKLGNIAPGHKMELDCIAKGNTEALKLDARLSLGEGSLSTSVTVGLRNSGIHLSGTLGSNKLDIRELTGNDLIRQCSMTAQIDASFLGGRQDINIDTMTVSNLCIKDYNYSGIGISGGLHENTISGHIQCKDPHLILSIDGDYGIDSGFNIESLLSYADLSAINLDKKKFSKLHNASIKAGMDKAKNIDISIDGLAMEDSLGIRDLGLVRIASRQNEAWMSSEFADAQYRGNGDIAEFARSVAALAFSNELPALTKNRNKTSYARGSATLQFHDSRKLLSFIKPLAYIADSTVIKLDVSNDSLFNASISSPRIAYNRNFIKGLSARIDNRSDKVTCTLTGSEINIKNELVFLDNTVKLSMDDNTASVSFANQGTDISFDADFRRSTAHRTAVDLNLRPSILNYKDMNFQLDPGKLSFDETGLKAEGIRVRNEDRFISLEGGLSRTQNKRLDIVLNKIDISTFQVLLPEILQTRGLVSGHARIDSPLAFDLGAEFDINIENLGLNGSQFGTMKISGGLDPDRDNIGFKISNDYLDVKGSLEPDSKKIMASANLHNLSIDCLTPVVGEVFRNIGGTLDGKINLDGKHISAHKLKLNDVLLHLDYTNVPYFINGNADIDDGIIRITDARLRDSRGGEGVLDATLTHRDFNDMALDLGISLNSLQCLGTGIKDNETFYGDVTGSGNVSVKGPFDKLAITADVITDQNGEIHIPIGSGVRDELHKLLSFKKKGIIVEQDPYLAMTREMDEMQSTSELNVAINLGIRPDVNVRIDVGNSGSTLSCTGTGNIAINVIPEKGVFTINGAYNIGNGDFYFNAADLASKEFSINEDSSIKFNGDIMDSDLDIKAVYATKTDLSSLIYDYNSVSTRRVVECTLGISDKLSNPRLDFAIDVPDLNPTTKTLVESALSTEDKIQKQFIALLVTNNFLPEDQGINTSTNILYSNLAEIMSRQVNNILQKLDIPLDLGLKYKTTDTGYDIFDVALSTQLFNNRVSVNGNIGNRENLAQNSGDVVGDLDIEIKIDRSGKIRLSLFSHSTDDYTNYLDNTQRNGGGIAYQKEFNSPKDFFMDIFSSKEQRREREMKDAIVKEKKRIIISQ